MTLKMNTRRTDKSKTTVFPALVGAFNATPDEMKTFNRLPDSKKMRKYKDLGWSCNEIGRMFGLKGGTVSRRLLNLPRDLKRYNQAVKRWSDTKIKLRQERQGPRYARKLYQASCPRCSIGAVLLDYDPVICANTLTCVNCAWSPRPANTPGYKREAKPRALAGTGTYR